MNATSVTLTLYYIDSAGTHSEQQTKSGLNSYGQGGTVTGTVNDCSYTIVISSSDAPWSVAFTCTSSSGNIYTHTENVTSVRNASYAYDFTFNM